MAGNLSPRQKVVDKKWFFDKLRERKLTLRGLAQHLKLDPAAVSRMFSGERKMQIEEAHAIAKWLHVTATDVMFHAGVARAPEGPPIRTEKLVYSDTDREIDGDVLSIKIRPGVSVSIRGIPLDLTWTEAQKIANIILAHAALD